MSAQSNIQLGPDGRLRHFLTTEGLGCERITEILEPALDQFLTRQARDRPVDKLGARGVPADHRDDILALLRQGRLACEQDGGRGGGKQAREHGAAFVANESEEHWEWRDGVSSASPQRQAGCVSLRCHGAKVTDKALSRSAFGHGQAFARVL